MVRLVTSDNEEFNADKDVVERSVLIKNMLEGESQVLLCGRVLQRPSFLSLRCRWIRPTYPFAQCLFKCIEKGTLKLYSLLSETKLTLTRTSPVHQVLEYCEHHRGEPLPAPDADQSQDETRKRTTDISEWDQKFITVDQEMLFEIILAANYLDIKSLLYVYLLVDWDILTNPFCW